MRGKTLYALTCASALLLGGCSNLSHEETGGAAGAVMGALVGSLFGSGAGRATAVAVGGLVGGLAGASWGRDLDDRDRLKAHRAAFDAANAGSTEHIVWTSDEKPDVHGYAVPASSAEVENGSLCKSVRSVYVLDGEEKSETTRFCFKNGRWEEG